MIPNADIVRKAQFDLRICGKDPASARADHAEENVLVMHLTTLPTPTSEIPRDRGPQPGMVA